MRCARFVNLCIILNVLQRRWHEAVQTKPISGDELYRIYTHMTRIQAAIEREVEKP